MGFYGLGLIVRLKLFPFMISWRPHYCLSAMWPFGPSTLGPSTIGSIVEQSILLNESIHLVSLSGLFMFDRFCLCCQVHPSESVTSNFLPLQRLILQFVSVWMKDISPSVFPFV